MVSPRQTMDVENRRGIILNTNIAGGIKSQLLQKPAPFGDVRNTLTSARQILGKGPTQDAPRKTKEADLKLFNPTPQIIQPKVEVSDWDMPLAFHEILEDTYNDILPPALQLTNEDLSRLVLNRPGPRTGIQLNLRTYEDDLESLPDIDLPMTLEDDYYHCLSLDSDDELEAVPEPFSPSLESLLVY